MFSTDFAIFIIVLFTGAFGLICSTISLYLIHKNPALHTAFGVICAAHSIVECGILSVFVFWSAPLIFFDTSVGLSSVGIIIGFCMNYWYYCALYIHFIKSFNRLCAIVFSIKYWTSFTKRNAKILIFIVAIGALWHMIIFIPYSCNFYYDSQIYSWTVRNPYLCDIESLFFIDFATGTTTMGLSLICDIITFSYLKLMSKKTQQKRNHKMSKEVKFYFQACLTTCIYGISLVSLQFVSRHVNTLWVSFASTQLAWQLTHALNQFVFVLFNLKRESPIKVHFISSVNGVTNMTGNRKERSLM